MKRLQGSAIVPGAAVVAVEKAEVCELMEFERVVFRSACDSGVNAAVFELRLGRLVKSGLVPFEEKEEGLAPDPDALCAEAGRGSVSRVFL